MSFPRCALLWARLPARRRAGHRAAICSALRAHNGPFSGSLGRILALASASSSASGGSKAPNTSLFVPLTVKPQGPSADGDVGAELTRPLDKNEVKKILDKFYKRKEIQKLGADYGLDARLFHQAFISFRNYIVQSHSLDVDIHIILNDICFSAAHVDDLFPFFLRHAKQIFPMLECKDDLRKISDLRIPPNWLVSSFVDLKLSVLFWEISDNYYFLFSRGFFTISAPCAAYHAAHVFLKHVLAHGVTSPPVTHLKRPSSHP
nr:ATP-dependent RNA helicase SUPV3L1, mitochondrial-like [Manis javanica]